MSPASKSKSKDKKAAKEPSKTTLKPSGQGSSNGGIPGSGYNPLLGTFHTLESAMGSSPGPHVIGRFRNIDEPDDHGGNSIGSALEYDIVSNNDSWSGDSEDHKEKASHPPRPEVVPGADNDKREKIRQKNERKHQRQKERRAQELHERCTGYLMSRKLEALAQQLVGMGFSQERATMALILNEGRVEESVNWLFESGEESDTHREHNLDNGNSLKINISEELARMADMENRYKCSKQEVERAVVACEGDLDKAEEGLRTQKQEPQTSPPKPEEAGDPPTVGSGKLPSAVNQNFVRTQPKLTALAGSAMQQKRDEKDLNYSKAVPTAGFMDPKNMHSLKRIQPKAEWGKPQLSVSAEKRWSGAVPNPSLSYSLASPLQASPPPVKSEARYVAVGNEVKSLQLGSLREPVTMMHQPVNSKPNPTSSASSSPPGTAAGWYPINVESVKHNGLVPSIPGSRSLGSNSASTNPMYGQFQYQQQLPQSQFVSSSGSVESVISKSNPMWSRSGTSPTLAAASSLGLFSGLGTSGFSGSSSPVDWNNGSMLQLDYANIDWSVDRGSSLARSGAPWPGMNSYPQNNNNHSHHTYDSFTSGLGIKASMRNGVPNGDSMSMARLQQDGVGTTETSSGGSREWTSPFEERDIFSLSRQFVSPPSL
ncbi:hypothetical protein Leryth_025063 [Lithospermum erythrorhizon]|nr:hypothetical protein Leryth_025063 [Lithospermum erythrorhizon]